MNSLSNGIKQRFSLGQLVATPGALAALERVSVEPHKYIARHVRGDWGDMTPHDKAANDSALAHGARLLSSYRVEQDLVIWVITEADRSVTTILLPEEY